MASGSAGRCMSRLPVGDGHLRLDPAANEPVAHHGERARGKRSNQVVADPVGHCLVERALVPVAPEVELEALQLDAALVRDVADLELREVRLPGQRTETGELPYVEGNLVVPVRR